MTSQLWNMSVRAIQSIAEVPIWVQRQGCLNFEDVLRLPSVEAPGEGVGAMPSVEERLLRADYLDFLREQIQLESRGPEWGRILKRRLTVLQPFCREKANPRHVLCQALLGNIGD